MQLRAATTDDVRELTSLWIEFMDFHGALPGGLQRSPEAASRWSSYVRQLVDDEAWLVLVAEVDGTLAGYLTATISSYPPIFTVERFGFLQEIAVTARLRRRGIARALLAEAERWLFEHGVDEIQVKLDVTNPVSQAFWRDRGYGPYTETLIKRRTSGASAD